MASRSCWLDPAGAAGRWLAQRRPPDPRPPHRLARRRLLLPVALGLMVALPAVPPLARAGERDGRAPPWAPPRSMPPVHAAAATGARAAVVGLGAQNPGLHVNWQRDGVLPEAIAGLRWGSALTVAQPGRGIGRALLGRLRPSPSPAATLSSVSDAAAEAQARAFFAAWPALLGGALTPAGGASATRIAVDRSPGRAVVRFAFAIATAAADAPALPVVDAFAAVTLDGAGRVIAFASDLGLVSTYPAASISATAAVASARAALGPLGASARVGAPWRAVALRFGRTRPVYVVPTVALVGVRHERVLVDATDATVLDVHNEVQR